MAQRRKVQALKPKAALEELETAVRAFGESRDWGQFHDPKNLIMALASEVGELNELFRWIPNTEADSAAKGRDMKVGISDEIGDVGILLLLLCDRVGVSLDEAIFRKLSINADKYPVDTSKGRPEHPKRKKASAR